MKYFCLIILSIASCMSLCMAQEGATKLRRQSVEKQVASDSLYLHENKMNIDPVNENLTPNLDKDIFETSPSDIALDLDDSLPQSGFFRSPYSKFILPTTFIAFGVLTTKNKSLQEMNRTTNTQVDKYNYTITTVDNYLQLAPAVAVYGLDFVGVKAKHNFRDRTLVMATSYLIMGVTVATVKTNTGIQRPDGSNNHSFPSGHTATAFVGAHILFKEYNHVSPWISIGGYTAAAATGAMRILNTKHWFSDVVAGAGVGILSAELGYMLLPVWHNVLGVKNNKKSLVVAPIVDSRNKGFALAYTF